MFKKIKEWFSSESEGSLSSMYENEEEYNKAANELDNFDKEYFSRIDAGEKCQQFLSIGGQQDCALIQSLLYSQGIPSYVENQNINRIYGANTAAVSAFAMKLYILTADYDEAYRIVTDYCNSNRIRNADQSAGEKISVSDALAVVTGLVFANVPPNVQQRGMGITILPKVSPPLF